ncbi:hypothetical protein EW146_g6038 [Bondarzewia mesenterica]|uniref:CobW/HypB/UreG nucleotide-binding domain-containing protein n=1 Tax=Bondarzewia mesenterica TaxID=1095465 RepID=A0A4S4LQB9_9AGAM|nr:hypothetical protein EW146_g6038 [Bondarzewia mesenterica]
MPSDSRRTPIPITVFTGFLGSGKTSIILSLLPQLPGDYRAVLLKNEFGDAQENYSPDRIIIECSGSAFPATLAFQIRELERETNRALTLDAIVTVIDAENFAGYEDTSTTARMQAQYTDVILINKWEHVSERALDDVLEHLNTLNDLTPKIKCQGRAGVDPSLIFGLDSKLFLDTKDHAGMVVDPAHHEEVETVTVYRGAKNPVLRHAAHTHSSACNHEEHAGEDDLQQGDGDGLVAFIEEENLKEALSSISKETVYRVKGFVRLPSGFRILNWAFGRYDLHTLVQYSGDEGDVVKLTIMGERGEVKRTARRLAEHLGASLLA